MREQQKPLRAVCHSALPHLSIGDVGLPSNPRRPVVNKSYNTYSKSPRGRFVVLYTIDIQGVLGHNIGNYPNPNPIFRLLE